LTTIITRTIGATGRDYASFLTAEADVQNIATSAIGGTDLVSNDGAIVFEADAGTYLATLEFQSTLTADATRNVTYKAAAGSEHGGVVGTGVVLQGTNPAMTVRDAWIVFDGLEINITESGNRQVVSLRGEGMRGTVYRNCILWGGSLTDTVTERIWANTGADTYTLTAGEEVILENNKLWCSRRTISLVGGTGQDARFKVLNNTLMGRGPNDTTTPALLRTAGVVDGTWVIDVYNNLVKDDLSNLTSTGDAVTVNASDNVAAAAGSSPTSALAGSQTWTFNTDTTASSTGSQAIWDASTGELVNVSGNDAIGVGIASEAPTTDINGDERIRDTHVDPGAFTTNLLTVTRTIGATGRDYTTFTLAEADVEDIAASALGGGTGEDLVAKNGAIVFEAEAGTYTETFIFNSNLTSDATRNVTYKAAAGSEHGGAPTSGVRLKNASVTVQNLFDDYMSFQGLVFQQYDEVLTSGYGLFGAGVGLSLLGCILNYPIQQRDALQVGGGSAADPILLENCVINCESTFAARRAVGFQAISGTQYAKLNNCTINAGSSTPFGVNPGAGSTTCYLEINNCNLIGSGGYRTLNGGVINFTGADNIGSATSGNGIEIPVAQLASSQTWTFSTDPLAVSTGSQVIYDAATGALLNVPGNDAVGVGTSTGAPTTDINGEDRIRDTHADPGAFTTQLRTITKSIDAAGGGDYTTFIAAEAATTAIGRSADLVKENTAIVFEADAGTYSETFIIDSQSAGLVTDATRNVTYTYASGAYHGGSSGAGVKISGTASVIRVLDPHTVLDGLLWFCYLGRGLRLQRLAVPKPACVVRRITVRFHWW